MSRWRSSRCVSLLACVCLFACGSAAAEGGPPDLLPTLGSTGRAISFPANTAIVA